MVAVNKVELVRDLSEKLKQSQSLVLADFKGLNMVDMTALRTELRQHSVQMRVLKNRLLKRALAQAGCDSLDEILVGNTAASFGVEDPVAPARILVEYAKKNPKVVVKGGLLEGKRLDKAGVERLARMPGRKELLAIMAGDLKQPAVKVAVAFQAGLLKVAYAMQALARKQQAAGEGAA
jgi:large subunit ribosomal protein L10